MHYYLITLAIVAGICFAFGILFLFTGLRRKDGSGSTVLFSLFALAYAAVILTGMANYSATSVDDWLSSARLDGVFVVLTWCLLIGYVAVYTGVKPRIFLALLLAAFVSTGIANVVRPNLIHDEILGLASVTLPWGEQLAYVEATDSIWATVFLVANLATIAYVLVACTLQFVRGERQPALVLAAGMAWFIVTIIVDILVDLGIAPLYLGDFGFLGLAIVLGLQLSNQVIQTEEELARHRHNLEELVGKRTRELEKANEQLESEIGERRFAEATLQQRVEELAVLGQITQMLVTVTDLPLALERVCEAITHLFAAQVTYVVSPSNEDPQLQVLVGFDRESGPVGATPLPVSLSEMQYFSQVLSQAKTLTLSDVQALPLAAPMHDFATRQRIQNVMLVPLVIRGEAIGLLVIATDRADQVFTLDQSLLAETIVGDVAGAIENARLFEQAQEAAAAEERSRLARDLHDAVTQTIYSATLIAEALPHVWARDPAEGERNLVKLRQLVRGALAEMRTLLFELRPTALEAADLGTLLHYLGDALTGRTRVPVEVHAEAAVEGEIQLPSNVKVALYRIAQEVFNNIAKHARATQVAVTLHRMPDRITLTIQDNGRGFDLDSVSAAKLGLSIMHERAEEIGAQLAVESQAGQSTRIAVTWLVDNTLTGTGGQRTNE